MKHLETWRRGVVLADGYKTAPAAVELDGGAGKGAWIRVTMGEGRKRQIREIGSLLGLPIVRIVRTRIGSLRLGQLKPGEWRRLSEAEVLALKSKESAAWPTQRPRVNARRVRRP
jgi:23S rRNA pseudouridine2605 synthase